MLNGKISAEEITKAQISKNNKSSGDDLIINEYMYISSSLDCMIEFSCMFIWQIRHMNYSNMSTGLYVTCVFVYFYLLKQ